jgi:ribonucleoside-diphosphate reductase alpha chain
MTRNRDIPFAKSLTDYIFRFLGTRFIDQEAPATDEAEVGLEAAEEPGEGPKPELRVVAGGRATDLIRNQLDAPVCANDGSIMIRNGACYKCMECGDTSGCS